MGRSTKFYRMKALTTSEQVITSVVEKKTIFISKTLRFILENQDRGLGIGDRGSGIPEKGRKIRILLYYIKNLTQTIISFISLTTFPLFLNPFMFYLLL